IGSGGLLAAAGLLAACRGASSSPSQPPATGGGTSATPAQSAPTPAAGKSTSTAASTGQPRRGGVLRVAYQGSAKHLDPARYLTIEDENMAFAVYNALTRLDAKLQVQPDLATSWTSSDDLKTWTFKLREGVTFHHGKAFNADDVVHTFTRILDPELASPGRSILSFVDGVEKQGDHT